MHRERVDRHCKGVTTSLNEFKARFQQMVEEHDKEVSQDLLKQSCQLINCLSKDKRLSQLAFYRGFV